MRLHSKARNVFPVTLKRPVIAGHCLSVSVKQEPLTTVVNEIKRPAPMINLAHFVLMLRQQAEFLPRVSFTDKPKMLRQADE
jgi:hypothetical protein